jgi:hypothetical protein
MERVVVLTPPPPGLRPPSLITLVRTGLLPSVIDTDRPPLDTGSRFSVALGGAARNATSATMMGNLFIFTSWVGLAVGGGAFALMLVTALRRTSPWALMFAGLVYLKGISFAASYPDLIPGVLQGVESMAVAYVLVRLFEGAREEGYLRHLGFAPRRPRSPVPVRQS